MKEKKNNPQAVKEKSIGGKNAKVTPTDILSITAKTLAEVLTPSPISLFSIFSKKEKKSLEEKKVELIKDLVESGVDPRLFDSLLSNEINRRLKVQFGVAFVVLTFIFTMASYLIVIFDSVFSWGISEIAITSLIIEIPLQFIGIMYIIARNLFPNKKQ